MKIQDILKAIQTGQFSDVELEAINSQLIRQLKQNRAAAAHLSKAILETGMKVKVNHPELHGRTFELTDIRRTKCTVRQHGALTGYKVPLSLVERV